MHGFARLAFWRKPAAATLEEPEPLASPEPATARQSKRIEAESSAVADAPELQAGWFARLKQALLRRQPAAQEATTDPDQDVAMERPSRKQDAASATADDAPAPKPSLLARLKSKLRRPSRSEQPEADDDSPPSSSRPTRTAIVSSQADPDAGEDALQLSRIQRLCAVLANKWVWVPGVSVMLIALIATMMWMLLQSGQEKKQLQIELVAAQKKLKQANIAKQASVKSAAVYHNASKQAGNPAGASVGDTPAPGGNAGGCDVSSKENVTQNLKNCIESFNAMAN